VYIIAKCYLIISLYVSENSKLVAVSEPHTVSIGDTEKPGPENVRLGDAIGDVKEDPAAPLSSNPPARGTFGNNSKFENFKLGCASWFQEYASSVYPKSIILLLLNRQLCKLD
jgi:hypothetical protein